MCVLCVFSLTNTIEIYTVYNNDISCGKHHIIYAIVYNNARKILNKTSFHKTPPATSSKNTFMLWSPYGLILVSVILFTAMNLYIELSVQSYTQNSAALLLTNISMTLSCNLVVFTI